MKSKIKSESGQHWLSIPAAAAAAFSKAGEMEVSLLRDGLLLVYTPSAIAALPSAPPPEPVRVTGAEAPIPGAPSCAFGFSSVRLPLSGEQAALLRKLSQVRFEERTPPAVEKMLDASEKKILDGLISRQLVSIFKNLKYPKGVYNISRLAYSAGLHAAGGGGRAAPPSGAMDAQKPLPSALPPLSKSASLPLAINTIEHLVRLGYMVLDNENEAKRVMPQIQSSLKNDEVKGVRGFDRRYYVLRRSFLMEFEGSLLALVDQGPQAPDELGAKLGLTPEAARVLLMILGDEGEVIERRRGTWVRA